MTLPNASRRLKKATILAIALLIIGSPYQTLAANMQTASASQVQLCGAGPYPNCITNNVYQDFKYEEQYFPTTLSTQTQSKNTPSGEVSSKSTASIQTGKIGLETSIKKLESQPNLTPAYGFAFAKGLIGDTIIQKNIQNTKNSIIVRGNYTSNTQSKISSEIENIFEIAVSLFDEGYFTSLENGYGWGAPLETVQLTRSELESGSFFLEIEIPKTISKLEWTIDAYIKATSSKPNTELYSLAEIEFSYLTAPGASIESASGTTPLETRKISEPQNLTTLAIITLIIASRRSKSFKPMQASLKKRTNLNLRLTA